MTWLLLPLLLLFAVAAFFGGRALAARRGAEGQAHSRPSQHGFYALIWTAVPALLVLLTVSILSGPVSRGLVESGLSEQAAALEPLRRQAFVGDAIRLSEGLSALQVWEAPLAQEATVQAQRAASIRASLDWAGLIALVLGAVMGGLFAFTRISPTMRARNRVEGWVIGALFVCASVAVLTTVGIIASLLIDAGRFFSMVSPLEFLIGTQWSPQTAIRADQVGSTGAFGALPLFVGTFLIMIIAMLVAAPVGLMSAIYLSEYAGAGTRAVVKPILEILAGVPTVVYGFFAALTVGPAMREFFNGLGAMLAGGPLDALGQNLMLVQNQMALVAGGVMGIMLIPFVSSLSDDILNAVPQSLRDGSYAMGATKSETVARVLMPAALPGVAGALLLAVSRAVGETMIVTMAAGLAAKMTLNPLDTVTTVTVQIVTLLTGDQEFNSAKTLSAFGLGLTLFVVTLALNVAAQKIVETYRQQYD